MNVPFKDELGRDEGFSLMEMLIALAIMSFATLILFQSLGSMLRITDRAVSSADAVLEDGAFRLSLRSVIAGLVPGWPENEKQLFRGVNDSFSGLTSSSPVGLRPKVEHFSLKLDQNINESSVSLHYISEDGEALLNIFEAESANFSYQGQDGAWHAQWPPLAPPSISVFADDVPYIEIAQLPDVIRLTYSLKGSRDAGYFEFRVSKHAPKAFRDDFEVFRPKID